MGATVSRTADHWYLAVQVEVSDAVAHLYRTGNGVVGIDLGVTAAATLSSGEKIPAPRPLKAALRRLRIRARRQSRKLQAAKVAVIADPLPKGAKVAQSANHAKGARALARLHARIANARHDFLHQLTTRLCRENQAVAIENLHVKGMLANRHLARSIADVGFFEFRRQMEYKAKRSGTMLLVADRWYPSSKLCSYCGRKHTGLMLSERSWTCSECGTSHDRDINAAVNLKRLATGALAARCALPVASPAATPDAAADLRSEGDGKVTLARHENGQPDGSGQEEKGHMDADLFDSSKMAW